MTIHFNPWIGCTKVSEGCKFCYAEELMDKRYGKAKWGDNGTRNRTTKSNWRLPIKWDKAAAAAGERHRVFCSSLADVFEDRRDLDPIRSDLLTLIDQTKNLDWLLLTKRPECVGPILEEISHGNMEDFRHMPNVWLGTSVENQEAADKRIPELVKVRASVRFLSVEPLLGPVDLSAFMGPYDTDHEIDWVIVGGESGAHARPMHPQWARDIRDQCNAAGVPFLFKQWGEFAPSPDGGLPETLPTYGPSHHHYFDAPPHKVWKFGKKAAGRTLDGRTWDEYPNPIAV